MWSEHKSLLLSKVSVIIFATLLLLCAVFAPWIIDRLLLSSISAYAAGKTLFLATIYSGSVPAAALLACMYLLLHRIGSGQVFISKNTQCLRHISWCCFAGAAICLASSLYYVPWLAIGVASAFMGLIVRVIKNVVAKAVSLQDDADFTI